MWRGGVCVELKKGKKDVNNNIAKSERDTEEKKDDCHNCLVVMHTGAPSLHGQPNITGRY